MKLGIISTVGGGYSWAGSEEMWRLVAEAALANGHSVRVNIATSMAQAVELTKIKTHGGRVGARPEFNGLTRRMARRGLYSRFGDFRGSQDDVVVLSMGAIADCVWIPDLLRCFWKSAVPWVIIVQGNGEHIIGDESQREILRKFYARAKLVVFVSQQNLTLAERQLAWRFTNARVLPNPIRERMTELLAWPEQDDIMRLAEVARFEILQKRQDHLLEALSSPEWLERSWKLTFYGSGPDESHIRALVKHFGLESKIEFGGYVRDLRNIWSDTHLHILPSAYEGLPLSLIESMFCGRPALVTRAGGNTELVRDGVEGFVSPGMHPEIIRETLERAWTERSRWQEMGRAAFDRANKVVPKDWAAQMLALVETAAAK
jgi:glycosyltransferase involved in cell wall biosynthesis